MLVRSGVRRAGARVSRVPDPWVPDEGTGRAGRDDRAPEGGAQGGVDAGRGSRAMREGRGQGRGPRGPLKEVRGDGPRVKGLAVSPGKGPRIDRKSRAITDRIEKCVEWLVRWVVAQILEGLGVHETPLPKTKRTPREHLRGPLKRRGGPREPLKRERPKSSVLTLGALAGMGGVLKPSGVHGRLRSMMEGRKGSRRSRLDLARPRAPAGMPDSGSACRHRSGVADCPESCRSTPSTSMRDWKEL